jgi:hypothetical protein
MSWHSTYSPLHPGNDNRVAPEIDRMARRLATQAGADWDSMSNYPGFERNRWRDQAEQLLKLAA